MTSKLYYWLKGIKVILVIAVLGFGFTLFNAVRLAVTSKQMRAEVLLQHPAKQAAGGGTVEVNAGTYLFQSNKVPDKLIFRHTYQNWDLLQSLFAFTSCCLLLYTINGVNTGGPFSLKTADRIRTLGLVFIGYGLLNIAASFYMRNRLAELTSALDLRYSTFPADLSYLKMGVFVLIFSLVYRIGAAYQEENNLTI